MSHKKNLKPKQSESSDWRVQRRRMGIGTWRKDTDTWKNTRVTHQVSPASAARVLFVRTSVTKAASKAPRRTKCLSRRFSVKPLMRTVVEAARWDHRARSAARDVVDLHDIVVRFLDSRVSSLVRALFEGSRKGWWVTGPRPSSLNDILGGSQGGTETRTFR